MVILMVLLTVVIFAVVDLALRVTMRRVEESKARRERQQALDVGLRLEFADEAKSLKRVEVPGARGRILAVDDEPVVLDSFRKILVLAGYSVDTVESGPEALTLVRSRDYDFVFTDLKMPGMDGLEVIKGVHHLRPDIDIAVITGYGTIETAVDSMRFGAVDYVQKPFTEDELIEFARKLTIRRQARLERLSPLEVHLVTPSQGGVASPHVVNVPGGVYISPEHTWVSVEMTGEARIGVDDFFHKTVGGVEAIALPEEGRTLRRGDPLFALRRGEVTLRFSSPLSGRVEKVNHELDYHLDLMRLRPYEQGWVCTVEPSALTNDLEHLTIGAESIDGHQADVQRYCERLAADFGSSQSADRVDPGKEEERQRLAAARSFAACFLGPQPARHESTEPAEPVATR